MDVDKLKRGRHQPFYNVFVADGSSRYVAEDNIVEIRSPKKGGVLGGFLCVGKWFKRFEEGRGEGDGDGDGDGDGSLVDVVVGGRGNRDRGGRFVSNLREEYPDN